MTNLELKTDLELLDYLELFQSTVECAKALGISQSSCSRRYRAFSDQYGFGFDRNSDGYQASGNLDVLLNMRAAMQKLRIRDGAPRLCLGWQLGDLSVPALTATGGVLLEIRPMNSWQLLSLLELRLIDVALMGLLEFQALLPEPLLRLRSRRTPLSPSMLCVPLCNWGLKLLAHQDHPLHGHDGLTAEELSAYRSPALSLGMAPVLMGALQSQGLANQPYGLSQYQESSWEGMAADGMGLSYGAPHRLGALRERYGLQPLAYGLGIQECLGVVGHRDVLGDPQFPHYLKRILPSLQGALQAESKEINWLC